MKLSCTLALMAATGISLQVRAAPFEFLDTMPQAADANSAPATLASAADSGGRDASQGSSAPPAGQNGGHVSDGREFARSVEPAKNGAKCQSAFRDAKTAQHRFFGPCAAAIVEHRGQVRPLRIGLHRLPPL